MDKPFEAYKGDDPYVFVCYAHDDADIVYPELSELRRQGINIWYDEGIPAGSNWRAEIGSALEGATQVLFYVSRASINSEHCNREINFALDQAKSLVPVLLDDAPLSSDLKIGLSRLQMLKKSALADNDYKRLLLQSLAASQPDSVLSPLETAPGSLSQDRSSKSVSMRFGLVAVLALLSFFIWTSFDQVQTDADRAEPGLEDSAPSGPEKVSIAVLPFVNMSADPEQEYFSDGISEELLNLLTKNPELRVISRSSAFTFKGRDVDIPTIAAQLGVTHVLEGSVRKSGNTVRITAQLIDSTTDSHLWSETYDRELTDIFAIQDDVAGEVVESLNLTLLGLPETKQVDLEAYTLYLHGRELLHSNVLENINAAESMFQQALAIKPDYLEAWIGLAHVYGHQSMHGSIPNAEALRLRNEALDKAVAIDPRHPEVYAMLARRALHIERDLPAAISLVRDGLKLEPGNLLLTRIAVELAMNLGRLQEAEALASVIAARDPLCAGCFGMLGTIYQIQGRYDESAEMFQKIDILGNPDFNFGLAFTLMLQGKYDESLARWRQGGEGGVFRSYGVTMTLFSMGREEAFLQAFDAFKLNYGDEYPTLVARIYAWSGDVDSAFLWLARYKPEIPERGPMVDDFWEMLSVEFKSLHSDPRWDAHLRRLGMAPEQLADIEFDLPLPD